MIRSFLFLLSISLSTAWDTKVVSLASTQGLNLVNTVVEVTTYKGRKALKVSEPPANKADREDKLVILPVDFHNGTIELELAGSIATGAIAGARGFVGVAFRVADNVKNFECIYLRPTNGRADDQVRRNHSVQYISYPDFPWQKLRKEETEKYESYVDLVPNEWIKVKIVVDGTSAQLYVHGNEQPTLIIRDLKKGDSRGGLGLWIGPGTEAHFANLRVTE